LTRNPAHLRPLPCLIALHLCARYNRPRRWGCWHPHHLPWAFDIFACKSNDRHLDEHGTHCNSSAVQQIQFQSHCLMPRCDIGLLTKALLLGRRLRHCEFLGKPYFSHHLFWLERWRCTPFVGDMLLLPCVDNVHCVTERNQPLPRNLPRERESICDSQSLIHSLCHQIVLSYSITCAVT